MSKIFLETEENSIDLVIEPFGGLVHVGQHSKVIVEWPKEADAHIPTIWPIDDGNLMFWSEELYLKVSVNGNIEFEYWPQG